MQLSKSLDSYSACRNTVKWRNRFDELYPSFYDELNILINCESRLEYWVNPISEIIASSESSTVLKIIPSSIFQRNQRPKQPSEDMQLTETTISLLPQSSLGNGFMTFASEFFGFVWITHRKLARIQKMRPELHQGRITSGPEYRKLHETPKNCEREFYRKWKLVLSMIMSCPMKHWNNGDHDL
ncbi:hypothetical protein FQA39_LY19334 [Lamprigera yunnana]|nr:hypothetical protein FQA39_LY19334 [Lamprigera yunnana]